MKAARLFKRTFGGPLNRVFTQLAAEVAPSRHGMPLQLPACYRRAVINGCVLKYYHGCTSNLLVFSGSELSG